MNKLFTKIAGVALGLAMAIGVGVSVASNGKATQAHAAVNDVVTISSVDYKSVYFTGFESCTTDTNYQGTKNYTSSNADGASWQVYYGTASTDSKITGTRSCQLRLYSNKNAGYAMTTSDIENVKAFRFNYTTSNNNVAFKVQISTNEGSTFVDQSITTSDGVVTGILSSTAAKFRIKVLVTGGFPSSTNRKLTLDDFEFFTPVVAVNGVEIDGDSHEVAVGETLTMSATVSPDNATNKAVTWSISNLSPAGCATINSSTGVVTGVAAGTADVTVTTTDGSFTDTESVTVTSFVPVTGVELNKSSTSLYVGETETLTATVSPNDASNKNINWSSDATGVATVEDGIITAVAAGTAHITATSVSDGTKSASCTVTVSNRAVTGISLNKSSTSIVKGNTETLVATIAPSNATFKTVTWESSETGVATVSEGVVSAVAQGEAVISAKASGFVDELTTPDLIAKCTVTVTDVVSVGEKYIIVYASSATKKVLTGITVPDKGNPYGTATDYNDFPTIGYQVEIVAGNSNKTGSYGLKVADNTYLCLDSADNKLTTVVDTDKVPENASWNITLISGTFKITHAVQTTRRIQYNSSSPRFACYAGTQQEISFIKVADSVVVGNFVETKMHMSDYDKDGEIGSTGGNGSCTTYYPTAKTAYIALTETQQLEFATNDVFAAAKARFAEWARINEDTFNTSTGALSAAHFNYGLPVNESNNSVLIIVIISMVGLTAIGGYLLIRRRKED